MKSILCIIILFLSSSLQARVIFKKPTEQANYFQDQSIKSFRVINQDYQVIYSATDVSYGTRMFAEYQTQSLTQLEDYAVVQFIRGCQFHSFFKNNKVEIYKNIARDFFGERVTFQHPNWVVDSVDTDPIYNNTPSENLSTWKTRHGLYRWNYILDDFDQSTEVFYYQEKPKFPRLYTQDRPGTAFFENKMAKNISLEFKTCLFKTNEVPSVGTPQSVSYENAIECFDWKSSYIYNHEKSKFEQWDTLHPVCLN